MGMSIGFVGLGIMGKPMCKNLIKAGHNLTVFDVVNAPLREVESLGASVVSSSKEVAGRADLIITMLPDSQDVQSAVLGLDGVFDGIRKGSIYIDMSTISSITTKNLAEIADTKGVRILDAPVSGGEKGAIDGTLTIMVGGDSQLLLGTKAGVNPEVVLKVIAGGYAMRVLNVRGPMLLNGDFRPGFKMRLHHKDLGIALSAGSEYGVPLPVTSIIYQMMTAMKTLGRGELDHSALITLLEDLAKTQVKKAQTEQT